MDYAGFWRRTAAFLIDYIPILIIVTSVFYCFLGLDQAWEQRRAHPYDPQAAARFSTMQTAARLIALAVWLVLCTALEPTRLQGSFGKFLLRIKVLGVDRQRITLKRAIVRNATKIASGLALSIGYLWVAFTDRKQAWHDIFADTVVVWDSYDD